ncbi:MAG: hypothetical protein WDM78_07995 [Puia sp.]
MSVTQATGGTCSGNLTNQIDISLSSPIRTAGSYQIALANGTDGNTLTNQCDNTIAAGSSLPFVIGTPVSAAFDYTVAFGCKQDTIQLNYLPAGGVNQSVWNIDTAFASSSLSPAIIETIFGLKNVQHIVSNGFCSDTLNKTVNLDNIMTAAFTAPNEVCPKIRSLLQITVLEILFPIIGILATVLRARIRTLRNICSRYKRSSYLFCAINYPGSDGLPGHSQRTNYQTANL